MHGYYLATWYGFVKMTSTLDATFVLKSCSGWRFFPNQKCLRFVSLIGGRVTKIGPPDCYLRYLHKSSDILHSWSIETATKLLDNETMKNWLAPLAVLGLSAVGLAVASERGRDRMRALMQRVGQVADPFSEFNKFCDDQLKTIQVTLDRLSESLQEEQQA